ADPVRQSREGHAGLRADARRPASGRCRDLHPQRLGERPRHRRRRRRAAHQGREAVTTLGLALADETNGATVDELVERCRAEGVDFVELPAGPLERAIGAPVPTVALEPPPENGIELGLLELEEEVLLDSYELARATFDSQLREWRRATSLAPAGAIRRSWEAAGLPI